MFMIMLQMCLGLCCTIEAAVGHSSDVGVAAVLAPQQVCWQPRSHQALEQRSAQAAVAASHARWRRRRGCPTPPCGDATSGGSWQGSPAATRNLCQQH